MPAAINTAVLGYKQSNDTIGKTDAHLSWFEELTYRFCQKDVAVQMAFLPKDDGALDIKARPADLVIPVAPGAKPATAAPLRNKKRL